MKLQVAFDVKKYSDVQKLMKQVGSFMDILEVGTLLIKSQGIKVIRKAKKDYGLPVFADLKCMDAGKFETDIAVNEGADYVTVLGTSYDNNIVDVINKCREHGIKSVVDSINCPIDRIAHIQDMGIDVVELHTGYANEVGARPWDDLQQFYEKASKPIFISGGVSSNNLKEIAGYSGKIETAVVGRAIVYSKNPVEETNRIKEILNVL